MTDGGRIIGLVGFRCSGKSFIRQLLVSEGVAVFDTNSVRTGDADAKIIDMDEILRRYGNNRSYLLYLKDALSEHVSRNPLTVIDSLKLSNDTQVLAEMFPNHRLEVIYLHAPMKVRSERYRERDLSVGLRSQELTEHDKSLEQHGIWELIKSADFVINTNADRDQIAKQIGAII